MESNDDLLYLFTLNLCRYFSRNSNLTKCTLVKKHRDNFVIGGDFSFPLNYQAWQNYIDKINICDCDRSASLDSNATCGNSQDAECNSGNILHLLVPIIKQQERYFISNSGNIDEDLDTILGDMIEKSKSWSLVIDRYRLQHNRLYLYIHRVHAFKTILQSILSKHHFYGRSKAVLQNVQVTVEKLPNPQDVTLSQWRAHLVSNALCHLLEAAGYRMEDVGTGQTDLHLYVTSQSSDLPPGSIQILCGTVATNYEKSNELMEDFICTQRKTLLETASLRSNEADLKTVSTLSNSAAALELLGVKPSHKVTLGPANSMCTKAALSVHYNCARLTSIHALFNKKVAEGTYPSLIPIQDVDFSLLVKEDEWELLFGFLLTFPDVLHSCVDRASEGCPAPHLLCNFLKALCYRYSRYYRRVRILMEPRDHLLPVMFARLYLNLAIEQVIHNALRLLDITPITFM